MSQITPIAISIRAATVAPRPAQPKAEATDVSTERTQALTRQLDEKLTTRLSAIRSKMHDFNPSHLGQMLDIQA